MFLSISRIIILFPFQSGFTSKIVSSNLNEYKTLKSPRIVWAAQDLGKQHYGNYIPNIYVSKNVSSQVQKSRLYQHVNFEGHILDLRTFFNDSDKSSFILMTNGTRIFKAKFLIEDETKQRIVSKDDEDKIISGSFGDLKTAAASFRYAWHSKTQIDCSITFIIEKSV